MRPHVFCFGYRVWTQSADSHIHSVILAITGTSFHAVQDFEFKFEFGPTLVIPGLKTLASESPIPPKERCGTA